MRALARSLLLLAVSLSGCGGGGGAGEGVAVVAPPAVPSCPSGSAIHGTSCVAFATRTTLRAPTPFTEGGAPVTLEVVLFTPLTPAPHRAVVFHHGSTGNGDQPARFAETFVSEPVAKFFAERGWLVAFPQRRGRGASGGLYDEGFEANRSRYSCSQGPAFQGIERALADADVALDFVRNLPQVDGARVIAGGHSRGGLLAIVQAGRRTEVRAVVNFGGGWLGEGCGDYELVNRSSLIRGAGSTAPGLWLYARADPFYSVAHSQASFDAFRAAGGQGTFRVLDRAPGADGHLLLNDAHLWGPDAAALVAAIR